MGRHRLGAPALALLLVLCARPAAAQEAEPQAVIAPQAESELTVSYPDAARGEALVLIELVVLRDGSVSEPRVLRGVEPFASAALTAASGWRFRPALSAGQPTTARIRLEIRFVPPAERERRSAPAAGEPAASPTASAEVPIELTVHGTREPAPRAFSRAEVRQLPGAFGDPFRAIEVLPGVTPIASGLPYFYVRGAPPGNVGYFIDGVRVPGLYHLAAGPAVIHPAFIEQVELYPGPYPARYGHFAGGIVAGTSAPPSSRVRGEANLRLVDAGAMLEAPLWDGRAAIAAAGRYSYTSTLVSLIVPELELDYWDYQTRMSYRLGGGDTLRLFAFGSHDFAAQLERGRSQTLFDVTFHRLALGLSRQLENGDKLELSVVGGLDESLSEEGGFVVRDRSLAVRADFEHVLGAHARVRTGSEARLDLFEGTAPSDSMPTAEFLRQFALRFPERRELGLGAYVEALLEPEPGVRLMPGVRADLYASSGQNFAVSPRLMAEFDVSDRIILRHGLGVAHQPPSFAIPVPGLQPDSSSGLQTALQSSAGVALELPQDFEAQVTLFQSVILDATDALGVSRLDNGDPTLDQTSRSLGGARGLELSLQRSLSRSLGGFVSYTLSRSERSLGRASGPSTFDRTHVFNLALAADLGRGLRAGARFSAYSGIPGDVAFVEAARHPPRTPAFYRLDWRLEKRWPIGREGAFWALVAEVLNTTLNTEVLNVSCHAYACREQVIGPVTIPSLGLEAVF